jgi:hypothetical protein
MSTKKPYEGDRFVSGKELARCFDELIESLGWIMIETINYEPKVIFGIVAVGRLSYKLSQIEDALTKLGDSASEIMMESIVKSWEEVEITATKHIV